MPIKAMYFLHKMYFNLWFAYGASHAKEQKQAIYPLSQTNMVSNSL